jgi:hypothetical protein
MQHPIAERAPVTTSGRLRARLAPGGRTRFIHLDSAKVVLRSGPWKTNHMHQPGRCRRSRHDPIPAGWPSKRSAARRQAVLMGRIARSNQRTGVVSSPEDGVTNPRRCRFAIELR